MSCPKVAVFMGSISDKDKMQPCIDILKKLEIPYHFTVSSAHRTPERTARLVGELEEKGCEVFICAAGLAAHLAGAVAAKTIKPVLGVPICGSPLGGMDAMLATVQMPPGFPVGTLALDKVGARNAAWMAAQILALHDESLTEKIKAARQEFVAKVEEAAAEIEAEN
ncbi:5-(carboxyamino)imidazole ribonucleotide mutase [Maridesulfovibrio bastinii]|uniref:5-(carboxyamino)imidazole ribonucleotide mutase n=1 Tax=Maridesulfovibrio bastinii TaxID=47157 RepID=UPI000489326A|nr:5-(carboxyamino)imidazole ribonucleotide mutase [Maridesulfovibrio bastinii]